METKHKQNKIVKNVSSFECYDTLSNCHNAQLIDVRTEPEWDFIGLPDLSGLDKKTICVSWNVYPRMEINKKFLDEIKDHSVSTNDNLFLICRSGQRSHSAANFLLMNGFNKCKNVKDGFEGILNKHNKRSTINGWKFSNLPWYQK